MTFNQPNVVSIWHNILKNNMNVIFHLRRQDSNEDICATENWIYELNGQIYFLWMSQYLWYRNVLYNEIMIICLIKPQNDIVINETCSTLHDDVFKWKHFPRYWPFAGNSPVTGEFRAQRPVTRSVDVFFDLRLNKHLSKQSWSWWFETPSCLLSRHCDVDMVSIGQGMSLVMWITWHWSE